MKKNNHKIKSKTSAVDIFALVTLEGVCNFTIKWAVLQLFSCEFYKISESRYSTKQL